MSNYTDFYPEITTGHLKMVVGSSTPTGMENYLKCDGSVQSISTARNLAKYLGTSSGNVFANWNTFDPSGMGFAQNTVIYENGIYISTGVSSTIFTSTNGIDWSPTSAPTAVGINKLAYGNGVYVYVGNGGALGYSTDAITWTSGTSGTASSIYGLTYGVDKFVYVGDNRAARYSTDGITWTSLTLPSSGGNPTWTSGSDPRDIVYGNGIYVTAGLSGVLATSTNGITWTARTSGTTSSIYSLFYDGENGVFLYGGNGGVLATSTNGTTWTARTSGTTATINSISYTNGVYVYGDSTGGIATSTNLSTWTRVVQLSTHSITSVTTNKANNFLFVTNDPGSNSPYVGIASTLGDIDFYLPNKSITPIANTNAQFNFYIKK